MSSLVQLPGESMTTDLTHTPSVQQREERGKIDYLFEPEIPKIVELIDRVLSDFTNETTIEAVRKEVNALVSGRPLFKW